ncbi:MAG: hypothetical protein IT452_04705 [Planctomycetia bacterium]|nr:hypothetical protein [Planctomycetia bacterium]
MRKTGGWVVAGCAALLAVVLAAAGCRRVSRHATVAPGDDDIFTTDDFPGAPVQAGNVADDGRAMSPSGETYSQLGCFFNGDRGTVMVLFFTEGPLPADPNHLYATHFDGETWTPPVAMAAADGQPVEFKFGMDAVVAFLNTADHADADARERDGDAIVAWLGRDVDQDGPAPTDGENIGVYTTYFNAGDRDNPAANHGFQALADRVSVEDEAGEDALSLALVTDGLCGAGYSRIGTFTHSYGQDTTGIVLAWAQQESNDSLIPGAEDSSAHVVFFDLGQNGDPALPLVAGPDTRVPVLGFGASDSGLDSEETEVSTSLVAYNNFLFMRVASDDEVGADVIMIQDPPLSMTGPMTGYGDPMIDDGDDITLQVVRFDLTDGTMSPPNSLGSLPDSTDAWESNDQFISSFGHAIFGDDEGLAQILVIHTVLLADADAVTDFGSGSLDGELFMTGIDLLSGAVTGSVILDVEDPAIFDTVLPGAVDARLSRNGDYIWIAWIEPDSAGASDDDALRVAQFATTRLLEDGTVPAAIPPVGLRTSPSSTLSSDIDGSGVSWLMFQHGLEYVCGAQSDPDVMNLFFEHSDGTQDVVRHARLTADFGDPVTPSVAVAPFESFEDTEMVFSSPVHPGEGLRFTATDAGEGGEAFCAWREDVDGTAGTDYRVFARRTGSGTAAVEIDSAVPEKQAPVNSIRLLATPAGSEIGAYDPATGEDSDVRPHGWTRVHVLILESNTSENSGQGYAMRTRVYLADSDASTAFGDRFSPSAGTDFAPPTEISLPFVDPDVDHDAGLYGFGAAGDSVAVWFTELGHLYYQEYADDRRGDVASGWLETDGVSDPALVDDDTAVELDAPSPRVAVYSPACTCDNLHGAIAFWVKVLDPSIGHNRLQVRVRDRE